MRAAGCATLPAGGQAAARPGASCNRSSAGASTSYAQPAARRAARQRQQQPRGAAPAPAAARRPLAAPVAALPAGFGTGEIVEVKDLKGIRVLKNEDDTPRVEYLVEWKDGSPDTWEVAQNLADNLLRDYEQRWWGSVKKGDEEAVLKMLEVGGDVLARTVDENRRSALHFAAAMGKAGLVQRLLKAGAEVDLSDKEGYTPLHMAAGYMHTSTIASLLAGGADPEQEDRQGRSPLELVEGLRQSLPPGNPMLVQRRMALENVISMLAANMFEDVEPAAVLGRREVFAEDEEKAKEEAEKKEKEGEEKDAKEGEGKEEAADAAAKAEAEASAKAEAEVAAAGKQEGAGKEADEAAAKEGEEAAAKEAEGAEKEAEEAKVPIRTEWLIKFSDEEEPIWLDAKYVSPEVIEDYQAGLEYAQADKVLDCRQRGTMRKYLVRWQDGYPDTWEPEEHVSPDLIALYERQQGALDASSDEGSDAGSSSDGGDAGGGDGSGAGGLKEAVHAAAGGHAGEAAGGAAAKQPAAELQGTTA